MQQGRSSSTEGIAELQRRVAYLQREADMLRAEQAVLRAENEALAADKAVVQSENGLLRDRMRIMETSPFIPLFEPVIREAPDSDPIHVVCRPQLAEWSMASGNTVQKPAYAVQSRKPCLCGLLST